MSFWEKTKQFIGFEEELLESSPLRIQKRENPRINKLNRQSRVINFPKQKMPAKDSITQNDMVIVEPRVYEDSLSVSTYLKRGNPVLVNIKNLDAAAGKRFIDFICGSAYAFEGHMHRLGGTIFLFSPAHMGIIVANDEELAQGRPEMNELIQEEEVITGEDLSNEFEDFEYYDPTTQEEQVKEAYYA
ncbi:MAG: cell division protein SepF [Candidatus Margulisbacteria bacterium]|nr:cell division protein SepF [Candidatus Margulisiibacteriota bacterium]